MKLTQKYQPACLAEVVGQYPVHVLVDFAKRPDNRCFCLVGGPGSGKTASALALASELGCVDEFSGLWIVNAPDLSVEMTQKLFGGCGQTGFLRLRPLNGSGWNVLVIEECEWLHSQVQSALQVIFERKMPSKLVVVATSNNVEKLRKAFLQRFRLLAYSGGPSFQEAAYDRLALIWEQESGGLPAPLGLRDFGWDGQEWGMRVAIDRIEAQLAGLKVAL